MKNNIWIWGVVIVVVALAAWYLMNGGSLSKSNAEYQAVFLSNGQVYFGKVSGEGSSTLKVTDIFYLRVQQAVQPKDSSEAAQPDVKLVKLGNEIHGPMDQMRINRDQVLFVEDLKDDGKVVTAIKNFQKNGETSTTTETPAPATNQ